MLLPGLRCASSGLRQKRKKEAERRQTCSANLRALGRLPALSLSPPPRAGRVGRGRALAYRRSTTALTGRAFGPWAQLQARLPGTWQDVRSGTLAPTGERRPRALDTGVARARLSQSRDAPPGPVIVPVSVMPAARMRSVSFRPRAPHSLHLQEYPRPKASFD